MKKPHKRILVLVFLLSLSPLLPLSLLADPGAPGSNPSVGATGGQFVSGEASGVPLDGGLIEIVLAGAVVGAFASRRKRETP